MYLLWNTEIREILVYTTVRTVGISKSIGGMELRDHVHEIYKL